MCIRDRYTDPNHIKVSDPGRIEGNVVFEYLDVFHNDKEEVENLKQQYTKGGLGDRVLKDLLFGSMNDLLKPIREKRACITDSIVDNVLNDGIEKASLVARKTIQEVRDVIGFQ